MIPFSGGFGSEDRGVLHRNETLRFGVYDIEVIVCFAVPDR